MPFFIYCIVYLSVLICPISVTIRFYIWKLNFYYISISIGTQNKKVKFNNIFLFTSKRNSSYTPVPINHMLKIIVLLSFSSITSHSSPSIPLISAPKGSAPMTTFSQGVPITESKTTIAPLSSSVLINRPQPCFNLSPISG